jgi:hypothetical protein
LRHGYLDAQATVFYLSRHDKPFPIALFFSYIDSVQAMIDTQEMARRFNEDEAVWRRYEHKRTLRRLLAEHSPLSEKNLDDLDWQAAERECREVRAVGFFLP